MQNTDHDTDETWSDWIKQNRFKIATFAIIVLDATMNTPVDSRPWLLILVAEIADSTTHLPLLPHG